MKNWNWLRHLISKRLTTVLVGMTFVFVGFILSYTVQNIYLTYGVMVGGIVILVAMYLDRDAKIKLGNSVEIGTGKDKE